MDIYLPLLIIICAIVIGILVYFSANAFIIGIFIIVIIILLVVYFSKDATILSHLNSGTKEISIPASKVSLNNNSSNYAYSIWFNVKNWDHRLGEKKILISRSTNESSLHNSLIYNPEISLASNENNININISTYKNDTPVPCTILNFPLQTWVNLILSVNGRTIDIYLDGKLVRTCLLPNVPKATNTAPVKITPDGGFSGWTSHFQSWPKSLNPQEAYNVYKSGIGSNSLGYFFNKYKLKFSYVVDNVEQGSVEI